MRRFVLLLKNGMGDVLMALPLVRQCVTFLQPNDEALILVKSAAEETIIKNERLDNGRVRIETVGDIWGGARWGTMRLALRLRQYRPSVLLLPHSTAGAKMTMFALLAGAETTVAPESALNALVFGRGVAFVESEHKVLRYLRFAERAGLGVPAVIDTRISLGKEHRAGAQQFFIGWEPTQIWIGLAPGSGHIEAHKRWPISHYVSLAERLLDRDPKFRIALIGSPAERELITTLVTRIRSERVIEVIQPNIMIAAAALTFCSCLVAGCSGSGHLAAAVGTPLVALFGPTNPHSTGPYASRRRIVRAGIRCSPCYRIGFIEGCGTPICMSLIDVNRVEGEVILALEGKDSEDLPFFPTTQARQPDRTPRATESDRCQPRTSQESMFCSGRFGFGDDGQRPQESQR